MLLQQALVAHFEMLCALLHADPEHTVVGGGAQVRRVQVHRQPEWRRGTLFRRCLTRRNLDTCLAREREQQPATSGTQPAPLPMRLYIKDLRLSALWQAGGKLSRGRVLAWAAGTSEAERSEGRLSRTSVPWAGACKGRRAHLR